MTFAQHLRPRHGLALAAASVLAVGLTACESKAPPQSAPPTPAASKPATTQPGAALLATQPAPKAVLWPASKGTGTFLDRDNPDPAATLRLMTYNVKWNSIFADVDAVRAAKFARLVAAFDPDVIALQEVGLHPEDRDKPGAKPRTAADVITLLNTLLPPPPGQTWHAFQGGDNVIASKYPLSHTAKELVPAGYRELAVALVDLPDEAFACDFYVLSNHYKCCDPAKYDGVRQVQSDALTAWLRDARTPGGQVDLPKGTPVAVVGDLNIVGSTQPVTTLVSGDVQDETKYGPDGAPDWDDTPLTDLHPLQNITDPNDWTWRDDTGQFKPARLDYIIYTDSALEAVKQYALNTMTMTAADLQKAGLQKFDVSGDAEGKNVDHLPLVVDFHVRCGE